MPLKRVMMFWRKLLLRMLRKLLLRKKGKNKRERWSGMPTYPPKKLRDDHHPILPNTGGKSLAALRSLVPDGSAIPSHATEPLIAAFVAPCWTLRFRVLAQLTNFSSPSE
nr:hypothetical protein [Tanacetum cinerariifolium]